jgi:hypothetical protein
MNTYLIRFRFTETSSNTESTFPRAETARQAVEAFQKTWPKRIVISVSHLSEIPEEMWKPEGS